MRVQRQISGGVSKSRTGNRNFIFSRFSDGKYIPSVLSCRCRSFISVLLILALMIPLVSFSDVYAELATNAFVSATSANVRSAPGTSSEVYCRVPNGTRVAAGEVVTITGDPSGFNVWCKISVIYNDAQVDGYVVDSYLTKDPGSLDPEFETAIAGFPESYKTALRALHEKHPTWTYTPVVTGVDWDTAVAKESSIGTSLITSSADDAWKSTDAKAYNWLTNTYTPYDGTSWVNASKDIVAYYLDPRNFLNDPYVFQFLSLAYDDKTQTKEAVQKLLNSTFMATAKINDMDGVAVSYALTFMRAGAQSGASPYFLVSRVIQEVSAGGSRSTSGTEPGFAGIYNYYNIGASSSIDPVKLGLTFALYGSNNPASYQMSPENQAKYLIPWNSPYRAIIGGSIYIAGNYILKGQNTLYFQKFDVTDDGNGRYQHQYMTNIQAMVGESNTLYNAYSKSSILDVPLNFRIPVYSNMPEAAIAKPAKTGNPNNYLSSLSINGYSLTPTFDPAVTDGYSVIVPYQVGSVSLAAAPVTTLAQVSGIGMKELAVGENPAVITVTAQNGSVRNYNITIVRSEEVGESLFTTSFRVNPDNTVAGINPGTTVTDLLAGITLADGVQTKVTDAAGAQITDNAHIISTGDHIQFFTAADAPTFDYSLLIYGDSNGDGKISSSDLTLICRHVLKESSLSGSNILAADANHDGKISSSDLTIICRHVLKESTITQ